VKTLATAVPLLLCLTGEAWAQDQPKKPKEAKPALELAQRYSYRIEPKLYPQETPKDTLESIIKAIVDQRFEYMLAHLADPEYVDGKVCAYMKTLPGSADQVAASLWVERLGGRLSRPDEAVAKMLPKGWGLVLDKIRARSPAANAGLQDEDILLVVRIPNPNTCTQAKPDAEVQKAPLAFDVMDRPADFVNMLGDLEGAVKVSVMVMRKGESKRIDDLTLPDLGSPKRLQAFRRLVLETTNLYFEDAARIRDLRRFAQGAEWKIEDDRATGTLKQLGNRQVFMRSLENRWFLENRQKEK
jgi:hypothetical protein